MCIACLECECDCQRSPLVHNSLFVPCLECECDCQQSPLVHNSLFVPCLECECDCQQSPLVHNSLFVPWPIATAHTACCICEQPYVYICTYVHVCMPTPCLDIGSCSIYRLYCLCWVFVGPAALTE